VLLGEIALAPEPSLDEAIAPSGANMKTDTINNNSLDLNPNPPSASLKSLSI
jgi:hypothetical protein